ncbi:MAG: T9SS type A sorting domain-containing protein [Candidatus Delongbacteria bacterium]|nr:T9SS type A sorting domain-containing protein [Candidatus Delongbacteria bacterium]
MRNFVLVLLIFTSIHSQYEWSEPLLLSTADHNIQPNIVLDQNENIYIFWSERTINDSSDYCHIVYSYSVDKGNNWTPKIDLTPENTYYWFHNVQAIVDSDNNIHICYNCMDTGRFYYQKCIEGVWSDPEFLNTYIMAMPRMVIDSTDRIYLFYMLGDTEYYIFKNKESGWTEFYEVPYKYYISEFVLDESNNIYGVGGDNDPYTDEKACLLKYEKNSESWTDFIDVSEGCINSKSTADNILLEGDGTIHIVIDDGISRDYDRTLYKKGNISNLNIWTQAELINVNGSAWWKYIFIDQNGSINILEDNDIDNEFLHHVKNQSVWQTYNCQIDDSITMNDFYLEYRNNHIYLTYNTTEEILGNFYTKIYFIKKEIETGIENSDEIVMNYELAQNYPNPFNPVTTIKFDLAETGNVKLSVFNINGQVVKELVNGRYNAGYHSVNFDASRLNSGLYFYRLDSGNRTYVKKMLLTK